MPPSPPHLCGAQTQLPRPPCALAEYGQVYRFEQHGALSGLLRVRGMSMNDAHIYCTEEQIQSEFLAVMRMHETYFQLFGIKDYTMRLSLWDPEDPKGKESMSTTQRPGSAASSWYARPCAIRVYPSTR
ncbi:MAG: aminoacyl--tRNA ligase-related protein [Myxococcota bacterium]